MDIRQITDHYSVTEQIVPEDIPAIVAAGFKTVLCNRPDSEVPPSLGSEAMKAAMVAAGLNFEVLPLTHDTMTPDRIARQFDLAGKHDGPVLAYCASGTRCTVAWALDQATKQPVDAILKQTAAAGYALDQLRPQLEAVAARAAD